MLICSNYRLKTSPKGSLKSAGGMSPPFTFTISFTDNNSMLVVAKKSLTVFMINNFDC